MSNIKEIRRVWLITKLAEQGRGSRTKLAKHLKIEPPQISRMTNEDGTKESREITTEEWTDIAHFFQENPPGLKILDYERVIIPDGHEEVEPTDGRPITELDRPFPDAVPQMRGNIGGGSTGAVLTIDIGEMQTREEVGEWWRIPPGVLRGLARSDVARTIGFAMDGDSMEPTIQRTDIVFIDTGRIKIEPDGIWALDYGLGRTLKRVSVERTTSGVRYTLKSDNKSYPDQSFDEEEVTIFGRYIGRFSVF